VAVRVIAAIVAAAARPTHLGAHVFLAVAAVTGRAASLLRAINTQMRVISIIGGLVLLLFGVLLLTENFTYFNRFAGQAPFDL
jgi:threonine/homoserine/homoserine lactone efflux protein